MSLRRVLRLVNYAIAVAIMTGLGVVYWFAWRPLPQTSGVLTLPIRQPARVSRDAIGVPHIVAGSIEDALFLQGFVTAQDRLWQMDALRRLAGGELSEVLGRATLESDREARRLRLRRMADELARVVTPEDRALLAAYARGVNYFIETHRDRLPVEFSILRYHPRLWSVADTILAALQMYRTLTTTWRNEIQKEELLAGGDPAKVGALFAARSGDEVQLGSNAWALAGSRTATGRPILANDPHLEFSNPSAWYLLHLQAPGLNVSGASLPGVPGLIIGHNERIAWGVTNLQFDVQDLYVEKFDPLSGRYAFRGQVEQARLERDFIGVKGARPVEVTNWVTRHGPLFLSNANRFMSLRWTAAGASPFAFSLIDLDRARNWGDFTAALARFYGPPQNFVYADVDGNIGYHVAGRLPIRKSFDGDVPVDGSSGNFEWDGFIPFDRLPSSYNPASGILVTANQNPFSAAYPYRVNGNFAPHYRANQIHALLTARTGWKAEEMLAIQKDVYSAFSHFLAKQVVAAWDARGMANPALADAIDVLRAWNGQMEKDQGAPLLATLIYQHVRRAVAEAASPEKGGAWDFPMAPAVIEGLLRSRPPNWFSDYNQMLLRSLIDAVEEGRRLQGRNIRKWIYGKYLEVEIAQPVGSRLPLIGDYFKIGPVLMSGSSTTAKQTTRRLGPSMRMVADLADWDHSFQNITIGESGQILSSHFRDQWDAYYAGQSFPMQFGRVEAKGVLNIRPELGGGR